MVITEVIKTLPNRGYFGRMAIYLSEMFPIMPRLTAAVILYFSFTLYLSRVNDLPYEFSTAYSILGILGIFAITLILRLMDELKDRHTDMVLFKDRPLPQGKVKEGDIKLSLVFICIIYIVSHLFSKQILLAAEDDKAR